MSLKALRGDTPLSSQLVSQRLTQSINQQVIQSTTAKNATQYSNNQCGSLVYKLKLVHIVG